MSHPSMIVCPCNSPGMPGPCPWVERSIEPFGRYVPYTPPPVITQDQIREWQEAWQRITAPTPRPRPWRGTCPPIGYPRRGLEAWGAGPGLRPMGLDRGAGSLGGYLVPVPE